MPGLKKCLDEKRENRALWSLHFNHLMETRNAAFYLVQLQIKSDKPNSGILRCVAMKEEL